MMSRQLQAKPSATTGNLARQLAAITIAFVIAVLLAQPAAAATDAQMEAEAAGFASVCSDGGGVASVHYEFNADGSLAGIRVACDDGGANGQVCAVEADGYSWCSFDFTQPSQSPVESTRPGAGTVGGAQDPGGQGNPVTDPASGPINRNGN